MMDALPLADWLTLAKIVVSILAVVGLSLVAEHVSPRTAGILAGYPLGTAIALFFIGIENGDQFAADSAVYTLSGFTASLVLVFAYRLAARWAQSWQVLICAAAGVMSFVAASLLLSQWSLGLLGGFIVTGLAIVGFSWLFRSIPDHRVEQRIKLSMGVVLFRAITAAAIVLLVTGLAKWVGPNWAGVLSAFPITLFPFLLIIHLSYGMNQVLTIIKHYPMGLGALVVYAITIAQVYPPLGTSWGTAVGFAVATVYLVVYSVLMERLKQRGAS